jgi:hypothetical protein
MYVGAARQKYQLGECGEKIAFEFAAENLRNLGSLSDELISQYIDKAWAVAGVLFEHENIRIGIEGTASQTFCEPSKQSDATLI